MEQEQEPKAQKTDEAPWDLLLRTMNEVKSETSATNKRVDALVSRVATLEGKVAEEAERNGGLEEAVRRLTLENATMRGEFEAKFDLLRSDLDKEIDGSLRDHVILYGLPGHEKKWEDTALMLAGWLAKNVEGNTEKEYDAAIFRAHRGPFKPGKTGPRPVFAKINYRFAERIRNKLKFGLGSVTIRDQFSDNTQERVNAALEYRKEWKKDNVNGKGYISYPAIFKTKTGTDTEYKVERVF